MMKNHKLRLLFPSVVLLVCILSATDAAQTTAQKVEKTVKQLREGQLQAAIEEYFKATSGEAGIHEDEIESIVQQVYKSGSAGQLNRIQDILEFTRELPDATAIMALNRLMGEMGSSGFLNNNTQIFQISHRIRKILRSSSYDYIPEDQKTVIKELNGTAASVGRDMRMELARQIRRNEFSELRKASQHRQSFRPHLSIIVSLAYSDGTTEQFQSALDISSNVWHPDQVLEVYLALARALWSSGWWYSGNMVTLTTEAFQFCKDEGKNLPPAVRTSCRTNTRRIFDQDLWSLLDGRKCTIRSTQFGGQLFASEQYAPQVFTGLNDLAQGRPDSSAYWTFTMTTTESGQAVPNVFRIRNVNGEFLFQDELYLPDRILPKVASRPDASRAKWTLVPQGNGNYWIRNSISDMYLYPAANNLNFSKEERRVFIWATAGDCDGQCRWNIQCN